MCHFISWYESEEYVYFLETDDLLTEKGLKFVNDNPLWWQDVYGHGAIKNIIKLPKGQSWGIQKETQDAPYPVQLPPEIVTAVDQGNLRYCGYDTQLLSGKGLKAFDKGVRDYIGTMKTRDLKLDNATLAINNCFDSIELSATPSELLNANHQQFLDEEVDYLDDRLEGLIWLAENDIFWDLWEDDKNRIDEWKSSTLNPPSEAELKASGWTDEDPSEWTE